MMDAEAKKEMQQRLRRIAGQIDGIGRMVEEDRYCVDVLLQLSAVQAALAGAAQVVSRKHVETCVTAAFSSGRPADRRQKVDELMQVFARTGHLRKPSKRT